MGTAMPVVGSTWTIPGVAPSCDKKMSPGSDVQGALARDEPVRAEERLLAVLGERGLALRLAARFEPATSRPLPTSGSDVPLSAAGVGPPVTARSSGVLSPATCVSGAGAEGEAWSDGVSGIAPKQSRTNQHVRCASSRSTIRFRTESLQRPACIDGPV